MITMKRVDDIPENNKTKEPLFREQSTTWPAFVPHVVPHFVPHFKSIVSHVPQSVVHDDDDDDDDD